MSGPSPEETLFARAVIAQLRVWPALRLALSNSEVHVSSSAVDLFASEILELFTGSKSLSGPDVEDVEDVLLQVMEEEFETVVDDGTETQIAKGLVAAWKSRQDPTAIEAVQALEAEADKSSKKKVERVDRDDIQEESEGEDEEADGGEDDAMDVDPAPALVERQPRPEPQVDEDGFTLVTKKGRR